MKLFCILKPIGIVSVVILGGTQSHAAQIVAPAPVTAVNTQVRDLVMETLLRGLSGTEVKPLPEHSAACLLIAPMQGEHGTLVVAPTARLMTVDYAAQEDVLKELTVKFGGSGLKIKDQLLLLTGELNWLSQQKGGEGQVLTVNFQRGPFKGFFSGAPRVPSMVKIAQVGSELCVAGF